MKTIWHGEEVIAYLTCTIYDSGINNAFFFSFVCVCVFLPVLVNLSIRIVVEGFNSRVLTPSASHLCPSLFLSPIMTMDSPQVCKNSWLKFSEEHKFSDTSKRSIFCWMGGPGWWMSIHGDVDFVFLGDGWWRVELICALFFRAPLAL